MITDRPHNTALVLICVILGGMALSLASQIFAPLAFALLIIALLWPLQRRLQACMPKLLALALCVLVLVLGFTAFASLIAWAFGRVGRWVVNDVARLQAVYDQLTLWLDGHGIAVATLWAEHFNVARLVRVLQGISARINSTMSFWLVVLVYVVLGLLEVDDFARKIRTMANKSAAKILVQGCTVTAFKIRRYMLVRTQMSIITGLLVYGMASLAGLPLAMEWGVIAFVMNYIPFIGPLVATLFPTALAVVEFQSWQSVVLVFAALNIIQFVIGSYLEPRVSGNALSISPFLVLFAVFFWTFLWGIFGAFIGVPVTIAILTFCNEHPASQWVAHLLGGIGDTKKELAPAEKG